MESDTTPRPLEVLAPTTPLAEVVSVLRRDGGVILDEVLADTLLDAVKADLAPHFEREGNRFQNDFNGYLTRRLSALLALSRNAAELIAEPTVLNVVDAVLSPHCHCYRLGSATAIEILPGEAAQELHQDDEFYPTRIPGLEYQVGVMWALDPFTRENGATRLICGSHWTGKHAGDASREPAQAVMNRGSALIYFGSTLHGGGPNRSAVPRAGLINTYALGWLRQEENQYLAVPRAVADSYPEHVRRLMGYQAHGRFLGVYPGDPDDRWYDA